MFIGLSHFVVELLVYVSIWSAGSRLTLPPLGLSVFNGRLRDEFLNERALTCRPAIQCALLNVNSR